MEFKWGVLGWGNFLTKEDAVNFCREHYIPQYRIYPLVDNRPDTSVSYIPVKESRVTRRDEAPATGITINKQGTVNPFHDYNKEGT